MNQKGFANIILVIVIVVLVGAVGYLAFVKKSELITQQPTLIPTQTNPAPALTDETSNWKTYRNEKYGIEFKYPPQWRVLETASRPSELLRLELLNSELKFDSSRTVSVKGIFTINELAQFRNIKLGAGHAGYGGYTYDFEKDKFYAQDIVGTNTSSIEKTWTEVILERKMPALQTVDGLRILTFGPNVYPCFGNNHFIFQRQKSLALVFNVNFCEDTSVLTIEGRKLFDDFRRDLNTVLEKVAQSLKFL